MVQRLKTFVKLNLLLDIDHIHVIEIYTVGLTHHVTDGDLMFLSLSVKDIDSLRSSQIVNLREVTSRELQLRAPRIPGSPRITRFLTSVTEDKAQDNILAAQNKAYLW